jgi:hypothetical protein
MYIHIDNFFDELIIIRKEAELVNLLDYMSSTGDCDYYLFSFADESRSFPQISVYAREACASYSTWPWKATA